MVKLPAQRRETRISLIGGAIVALLIVVVGVVVALAQSAAYTAESVIVVLPNSSLTASDSAAYYETLSRGQIVATFAEVANNLRFEQKAEDALLLTDAQKTAVTTTVTVVPDTSVILVRATAPDATMAEQMADGTTTLATEYLAGLSEPYRTDLVQGAQNSAYRSSTSPALLLALAVIVGLITGLAVQQAVYHLMVAVRRSPKSQPVATVSTESESEPATTGHHAESTNR